jgi:hypothetical protein
VNFTVHLWSGNDDSNRPRRISHINSVGSRFFSDSEDSTQRWPQTPSDMTMPRRSSPACVSLYSTTPRGPVGIAMTTPASASSFSRFESSVGDISGTPRLRSLKRLVPLSSSRNTSAVHREQMISAAIATGQNCP